MCVKKTKQRNNSTLKLMFPIFFPLRRFVFKKKNWNNKTQNDNIYVYVPISFLIGGLMVGTLYYYCIVDVLLFGCYQLLERRVTLMDENKKIQIALQVRSKLTNKDDLSDLSIAVSIPDIVVSGSVAVTTGEGRYDVMKRTMVWKLDELPKGESFMVTAEAELNQPMDKQLLQDLSFPALLRCHSKDKISNAKFYASDAVGYPSTVTASVVASSYRILHRLK